MKEVPILFSTPMVQAILDGRKTQTRRILNPQPTDNWMEGTKKFAPDGRMFDRNGKQLFWLSDGTPPGCKNPHGEIKPKCKPGDHLWVRETVWEHGEWTWQSFPSGDGESVWRGPIPSKYSYIATDERPEKCRTKPSIHMPKDASRIWLRVKDVRVERLNDISEVDAIAEGVKFDHDSGYFFAGDKIMSRDAQECYRLLWESINGEGSWALNSWVFVYTFEVMSTTGKPENLKP